MEVLAAVAPFVFIAGVLVAVAWVLDTAIAGLGGVSWTVAGGATADHAIRCAPWSLTSAGCLAVLLLLAARVDINHFSLNAFYRNRLVRCYLGASRVGPGQTGIRRTSPVSTTTTTSCLRRAGAGATSLGGPLHIVNCALNLGGSSDLDVHTRHSAVFTLNPLYCGTPYRAGAEPGRRRPGSQHRRGFVATASYGGKRGAPSWDRRLRYRARPPARTWATTPRRSTAFLMTLFNVRLGWWFPNPAERAPTSPSPGFSLRYLVRGAVWRRQRVERYVMISDGGHFENLAAYELVSAAAAPSSSATANAIRR